MVSIGIDPGVDGAVAAIDRAGVAYCWDMPVLSLGGKTKSGADSNRRSLDMAGLWRLVNEVKTLAAIGEPMRCTLERQIPFSPPGRKVGATSMFSLGGMYSALQMALTAAEIPYETVMPQRWKARTLDGTSKDKQAAIARIQGLFPKAPLVRPGCRVAHDGRADALCMAEYGRCVSRDGANQQHYLLDVQAEAA